MPVMDPESEKDTMRNPDVNCTRIISGTLRMAPQKYWRASNGNLQDFFMKSPTPARTNWLLNPMKIDEKTLLKLLRVSLVRVSSVSSMILVKL